MKIVFQSAHTLEIEHELEVDSPDQLREMLRIDALETIDKDDLYDFIVENGDEVYDDSNHEVTIYVRDDKGRSWSAPNLSEAIKMYNDQLQYQKDEELTKAGQLKLFK